MDAMAFSKLESALTAARVPRSLWPKYYEKEELRQLRRRIRDKQEYLRILRMKQDAGERERRRRFNDLLMLLLWLLALDFKGSPASFLQLGHRALIRSAGRWDWEPAERCLAGIAICRFGREATADALAHGVGNMDGDAVFPMKHAIRALEREAEQQEQQSKPAPAPAAQVQPELEAEPIQQDLDEQRQKLAQPDF